MTILKADLADGTSEAAEPKKNSLDKVQGGDGFEFRFTNIPDQTTHGTKVGRQPPIIVPFAAQAAPQWHAPGVTVLLPSGR